MSEVLSINVDACALYHDREACEEGMLTLCLLHYQWEDKALPPAATWEAFKGQTPEGVYTDAAVEALRVLLNDTPAFILTGTASELAQALVWAVWIAEVWSLSAHNGVADEVEDHYNLLEHCRVDAEDFLYWFSHNDDKLTTRTFDLLLRALRALPTT